MNTDQFAQKAENLRPKLYRTAFCFMGNQHDALDVLDETVYRGLCAIHKLKHPEYFDTWLTRILINECYRELKRRSRFYTLQENREEPSSEELDTLPLQEAVRALPKELREVVVLRFFARYTQAETAETLGIPQGTVATRQKRALNLLKLDLKEEEE